MRRRGARRSELGEAEGGFLRRRTVSLTTRRRYEAGVSAYLRFAAISGTPILMPSDVSPLDDDQLRRHDALLDKSIHRLFFDGASLQQAREHLYGVAWGLSRPVSSLPLARQAFRGFSRLCPTVSRDPVTWEETIILADALLKRGTSPTIQAAILALLCFDSFARPSEMLGLCRRHVVPPPRSGRSPQFWSIMFHPEADLKPAKNRTFDDTIRIGEAPARLWLGGIIRRLCQLKRDDISPFFSLTLEQFERLVRSAAIDSKIPTKNLVPHQFRHGGASLEACVGGSQDAIQRRGRWLHANSCRRYMKLGRYQRALAALTPSHFLQAARADKFVQARSVALMARM